MTHADVPSSVRRAGQDAALTDLYASIQDLALQPLWTQVTEIMSAAPRSAAVPWRWRWTRLRALAEQAGHLVSINQGGDRRVLALSNPGLGGTPFVTDTLWGALQYLGPHESAPAHRHTPGAVRFVLEGEGAWTSVNGDACSMARGDLLLTPGWNWHEHHNPSDQAVLWFDGLDLPLVQMLGGLFFEHYPDGYTGDPTPKTPHLSINESLWGAAGLVAEPVHRNPRHSPLLTYRWQETDRTLNAILQERGGPSAVVRFVDPSTGQDALPTMRCAMTRIRPSSHTNSVRTTGSSVAVVLTGSGHSVIGGVSMEWGPGDMIAIPSWAAVEHNVEETADLFTISDAPLVEAARLERTEVLTVPQEVVSTCE